MTTTKKIDLYKIHKTEYVTPRKPVLVHTKPAQYLAISGKGAPGSERFTECIGALYGMAFTIKMTRKFAGQQDYTVCKLEGQWHFDCDPASIPREDWRWNLLIRTPDFVTQVDLKQARAKLLEKGKSPTVKEVQLAKIDEGQCVQMLHIGPYDREKETVELMRAFAAKQGLEFTGLHHEIYLSDPRRVPPERLKTILRQPVKGK